MGEHWIRIATSENLMQRFLILPRREQQKQEPVANVNLLSGESYGAVERPRLIDCAISFRNSGFPGLEIETWEFQGTDKTTR
jgi:hypothetical protein